MNSTLNITADTRKNITEAVCFYSDEMPVKVIRAVAYCIIIIASLLGNTGVVVVVYKNKSMRRTINFFIANMSIADLLVTITYMPRVVSLAFAGYVWQVDGLAGLLFCKIACFNEVAILVAIFTIIAITVDRFCAVVFPLRREMITIPMSKVIIALIWVAAFAAAFSEFYAIELREFKGKIYCYLDMDHFFGKGSSKAFFNFIIIGFFAIPFTTILILYSGIITVLLKQRKMPGATSTVTNRQEQLRKATRRKVLKMVMVVVGTFVACWLLYFIHFIVYSYGIMLPCEAMFMRLFLAHFHCAFNPFIYGFYNGKYRRGIMSLIPTSRVTQCTSSRNNTRTVQLQSTRNPAEPNYLPQPPGGNPAGVNYLPQPPGDNPAEVNYLPQPPEGNPAEVNEGFEQEQNDTDL